MRIRYHAVGTALAFGLLGALSACQPVNSGNPSPVDTYHSSEDVKQCGDVLLDVPCVTLQGRPPRGGAGSHDTKWTYYLSKGDNLRKRTIRECPVTRDVNLTECLSVSRDGDKIKSITLLRFGPDNIGTVN